MKHQWLAAGAGLFALWLVLAASVHLRLWETFDHSAYTALRLAFPHSLDLPFSLLSLFGSVEITVAIFLAIVAFLVRSPQRLPLILAFGLVALIELLAKCLVNHPGPPAELSRYIFKFGMPTASIETPFSFPSGHAARAVFLGIVVADLIWRSPPSRVFKVLALALLIIYEAAMLVSRVYLGDHWLSDVVGGALLGAAIGWWSAASAVDIWRPFGTMNALWR